MHEVGKISVQHVKIEYGSDMQMHFKLKHLVLHCWGGGDLKSGLK